MAGRQSTPQPTPFWFSSSELKFMFIIHKPESLCNSSGKAVSFKGSLCSDVSPFQSCFVGIVGGCLWACL